MRVASLLTDKIPAGKVFILHTRHVAIKLNVKLNHKKITYKIKYSQIQSGDAMCSCRLPIETDWSSLNNGKSNTHQFKDRKSNCGKKRKKKKKHQKCIKLLSQ